MNDDNFHFERTSEKLSVARLGTCIFLYLG